jgi:hypothetical protein
MIVFNYPDRCPSETCHSINITPINLVPEDVPDEEMRKKLTPPVEKGTQAFMCNTCNAIWVETLVRSAEVPCFIAIEHGNWDRPLAILSGNPANAKKLFGLTDKMSYSIRRLEHVFDDGENRVTFVRDDPKKSKTIWLRGMVDVPKGKKE